MAIFKTCKDCQDRHPHCHSDCEKYKKECEENEKLKALMKSGKSIDSYVAGVLVRDRAIKAKRKQREREMRFRGMY